MDEYTGKPLSAAAPKIDADDELPKPKRRGLVFGGAVDGGAVDGNEHPADAAAADAAEMPAAEAAALAADFARFREKKRLQNQAAANDPAAVVEAGGNPAAVSTVEAGEATVASGEEKAVASGEEKAVASGEETSAADVFAASPTDEAEARRQREAELEVGPITYSP